MNNSYKMNLQLGDEAICSKTLRRFKNKIDNASHEQMRNLKNEQIHHFCQQGDIPQVARMKVEVAIHEKEQFPSFDHLENSTLVNAQHFSEKTVASILFSTELDTALEDEDFLNYIKSFFIEECSENLCGPSRPKNLKELIQSDSFFKRITASVHRSPGELLYMVLEYSIENSLSMTGMVNLFKFVNTIFEEPVLPDSKYLLDKLLNPKDNAEFYAVCHECSSFIGKFDEVKTIKKCLICKADVDLSKACNSNFFVIIDPSQAISDLLHIHEKYYNSVMNGEKYGNTTITDIYNGQLYREFVNSLSQEEKKNYVTCIFNTDGAPKFKSSQSSIWPIYLMLNELPIKERLKKMLCSGLWINRKKPIMSVFLDPFVDKVNALSSDGIRCIINNQERSIKLYVLVCCVDSVARASVQGIKQYNGFYGCSWYEHIGVHKFRSMRYPIMEQIPNPRDDQTTVNYMINLEYGKSVLGIKNPSAFINLNKFKIIQGFIPDYMHCILEGVGKQFTNSYLSSMTAEEIKVLDRILEKVQFPYQISRLTRPLNIRDDWSAREWENFILFSSIPLFKEVLHKNKLEHWMLLVESLYILLQDNITFHELDVADEMLHKFVAQTEILFSIKMMTSNVHQPLHLGRSAFNWGPLWAMSTFPFESENRNLLRAIRCARGATQQIVRFVNINHSMLILRELVYPNMDDFVKLYCDQILRSQVQNTLKMSNITYFGMGEDVDGDEEFLQLPGLSHLTTKLYSKIVKNGYLFDTKDNVRSNNSFAILDNEKIVRIKNFIVDKASKKEYTLCHEIITSNFANNYKKLQKIQRILLNYTVIPSDCINRICVLIKVLSR